MLSRLIKQGYTIKREKRGCKMMMKTEVDMYGRRSLFMSAEEREEARKIREIERRCKTELKLEVEMYGKTLAFVKMMRRCKK